MEEKESTFSGSPGNSGSDSAPVSNAVTQAVNVGINAGVEGGFGSNVAVTAITLSSGGGTAGNVDSFGKKKRGRPRKYDADGNLRVPYAGASPPAGSFSLTPGSPSELSSKRGRGRPPGSGNWQLLASLGELFANTAGGDFTPHVVTVTTGEDVAGKILSFTQKGPRGVCVLSANGAVSNVTIRQPGSSGGILTYEGRFEILSLSGSFTVSDTSGARSRTTGGLSVSLAGPDGRVIGGGIAGLLTAASPIQIVVGSFMPNGYKVHKKKHHREYAVTSPHPPPATDTPTMASPISQAKPVGFEAPSTGPPPVTVPAHQSNLEAQKSAGENIIPSSHCAGWNGSESKLNYGQSPDINLSVPFE